MILGKLIDFILFGFGVFSLICVGQSNRKSITTSWKKLDETACQVAGIAALFYVGLMIFEWINVVFVDEVFERYIMSNRMFGTFWYAYWFIPFIYLVSTQALWFKKVRNTQWIRVSLGVMLLISPEKIIIVISSLHRDFLPSSWASYSDVFSFNYLIMNFFLSLFFFIIITGIAHYLKGNPFPNFIGKS